MTATPSYFRLLNYPQTGGLEDSVHAPKVKSDNSSKRQRLETHITDMRPETEGNLRNSRLVQLYLHYFQEQRKEREDPAALHLLDGIISTPIGELSTLPDDTLNALVNFHRTEALNETHVARIHAERARVSHKVAQDATDTLSARQEAGAASQSNGEDGDFDFSTLPDVLLREQLERPSLSIDTNIDDSEMADADDYIPAGRPVSA